MKQQADKKRRDVVFVVGDFVYLKIHPYKMRSLAARSNQKLAARFYGPFEILEKIGEVAYKLQLPETVKIHPVFHVSLLKKSIGSTISPRPLPVELSEDIELIVEPEQIRVTRTNAKGELEVLVKWLNLPEFENTWELATTLKTTFPLFHLEDKVTLKGRVL